MSLRVRADWGASKGALIRMDTRAQMQLSGLDRLGLRDDLGASLGMCRENAVISYSKASKPSASSP